MNLTFILKRINPTVTIKPKNKLSSPTIFFPFFGGNKSVNIIAFKHLELLIKFIKTKLTPYIIPKLVKNIPKNTRHPVIITLLSNNMFFVVNDNLFLIFPLFDFWRYRTIDEIMTQNIDENVIGITTARFFSPVLYVFFNLFLLVFDTNQFLNLHSFKFYTISNESKVYS